MKKRLIVTLIGFAVLTGCGASEVNESAKASSPDYPEGFIVISEDATNISGFSQELKHKETGCHYIAYNESIEQMFVERMGKSIPYCD